MEPAKVLVVDDESTMRRLIRRFLTLDFTVDVVEADDGLKALNILLSERVDCVLLDLYMRGMDGLETLEAIRRSPALATLPAVLMTGRADAEKVRRAVELGVVSVLAKPFTRELLRDRVSEILKGHARVTVPNVPSVPSVTDAGRLEMRSPSRFLIVDRSPDFRAAMARTVQRLGPVEEATNEFAALSRCLEAVFDVVIVGETSELMPPEAFARKARALASSRPPKLVAAAAPASVDAVRATSLFDAVMIRNDAVDAIEAALSGVLGPLTLARLLLHAESPVVGHLFDQMAAKLGDVVGGTISAVKSPPKSWAAARRVLSKVDLRIGSLAWELSFDAPVSVALEIHRAQSSIALDCISDAVATQATDTLVAGFAGGFETTLRTRGLQLEVRKPRTSMPTEAPGPLMDAHGARRWLMTSRGETVVLELAPEMAAALAQSSR
jgi:two-component system, chemotaxis family, chemotaxis protein CheY